MSWIEKELKKRETLDGRQTATATTGLAAIKATAPDPAQLTALWATIEAENDALPPELRLQDSGGPGESHSHTPAFVAWLMAPNGAGLGFNGDAIRYVWPEKNAHRSNNFWIRSRGTEGFCLSRRVGSPLTTGHYQERRFDEAKVGHLLRCLVTGAKVRPRAVCRRRFGLF